MITAGSVKDYKVEPYANPVGETFLQPMVDFIESKGGRIVYGAKVGEVEIADGKIAAVHTKAVPQDMRVRRCAVCGELIFGDEEHHDCPFCGANGDMLAEVPENAREGQRYIADDYVVAMDTLGLQGFVGNNKAAFGGMPYFENTKKLTASDVYVANFWIDGKTSWPETMRSGDHPVVAFFGSNFGRIGVTFNWTLGTGSSRGGTLIKEYEGHDVTVIETHISNLDDIAHLSNKEIADLAYAELKQALPDLPEYTDFYLNKWRTYTGVRVGAESNRPTIDSPFDNLFFIGDIVAIPHVATAMEKTNVTAKMVVNHLLDKYEQTEGRITILQSGTPSDVLELSRWVSSVYA
jgi:uncharacterized protein with NAD-binding domain and iron-sulfur cluster